MNRVAVYVPERESLVGKLIDAKSGIVGTPASGSQLLVDYEGNRFGASNIVTFADRCCHAADRHATRYPTVARSLVDASEFLHVAWYYPDHGRIELVEDGLCLYRLAEWLGFDPETLLADSSDFTRELFESRTVRA